MEQNLFIPITKIDAERREVWGWGAVEERDNSDEIMDYNSSKPLWMEWSQKAQKRSGGKSMGNLRAMHQPIAAGKLIDLRPDDNKKGFFVGARIVDDNEWKKVQQGVYTGFSVGGSYQRRWMDYTQPGVTRYTAKPSEISIVDSPCIPSATFEVIKADGVKERRHFKPGNSGRPMVLVKWEEQEHPRANDGKFTSGGGGGGKAGGGDKPKTPYKTSPGEAKELGYGANRVRDAKEMSQAAAYNLKSALQNAHDRLVFMGSDEPLEFVDGRELPGGGMNFAVRDFGNWVNPPDKEYEDDYDYQVPDVRTKNALDRVVQTLRDAYPDMEIEANVGEKNWIDFDIRPAKETPEPEPMPKFEAKDAGEFVMHHGMRIGDKFKTSDGKTRYFAGVHGSYLLNSAKKPTDKQLQDWEDEWKRPMTDAVHFSDVQKADEGGVTLEDRVKLLKALAADIIDHIDDLQKQEAKSPVASPEAIASIDLPSEVGDDFEAVHMPEPNATMNLNPDSPASQDELASHAVASKDLTTAFEAWLPKVAKIVQDEVDKAISKMQPGESIPAKRTEPMYNKPIAVVKEKNKNG